LYNSYRKGICQIAAISSAWSLMWSNNQRYVSLLQKHILIDWSMYGSIRQSPYLSAGYSRTRSNDMKSLLPLTPWCGCVCVDVVLFPSAA
jgi:hypothetical protein